MGITFLLTGHVALLTRTPVWSENMSWEEEKSWQFENFSVTFRQMCSCPSPLRTDHHSHIIQRFEELNQKHIFIHSSPSFTGDDAHFLTVPMWCDTASLPPLIIWGVDDVEDVPVAEAEPLTGQPTVLWLVIVKQSPVEQREYQDS